MQNLMEQLTPSIVNIVTIILGTLATWLAFKAKLWLDTQQKKTIVSETVRWVEQVALSLGSAEKLEMAKKRILELCAVAKIKITDVELETMIEAFVHEFTEHYTEPVPVIVVQDESAQEANGTE